MKLTILGAGAMTSSMACSSYLIESKNNALLIDLGFGSITNLKKVLSPLKIHNILITHYLHADHIIDLIELLWVKKILKEKNQLNVFGPKGINSFINKMLELFPELNLEFKLKIKELEYNKFNLFDFCIESKPVKHANIAALGYRIKLGKKVIVYSGDTEATETLIDLSKNADILILDCNNNEKKSNHMTAEECALIAEKAKAKTLILSHLSHKTENLNIVSIAKKYFNGKIIKAKDLMQLKI
jgi:ribonuclease BN (tRNA processing enzyme)